MHDFKMILIGMAIGGVIVGTFHWWRLRALRLAGRLITKAEGVSAK